MIEESALVTACDGELAEVETQRSAACGACAAKGACGVSALSQAFGDKPIAFKVRNPLGARPGERVIIGLQEGSLTRAAAAAYLAPIGGLIAGAAGAHGVAEWTMIAAEPLAILGGLLGLAGGLGWLAGFGRRIRNDQRYQAVILRRADQTPIHCDLR